MTTESARRGLVGEILTLLGQAREGALATLLTGSGAPYVSLVNVAPKDDGEPILLLSQLAWHTKNIATDPRASLLLAAPATGRDVLEGARVSLIGTLTQDDGAGVRTCYLAYHPSAARYDGFADFNFYCFIVSMAHYVAGFGRIETFTRGQLFDAIFSSPSGMEEP